MRTWQKHGGSGSVSQPYNKPQRSALKFEGPNQDFEDIEVLHDVAQGEMVK